LARLGFHKTTTSVTLRYSHELPANIANVLLNIETVQLYNKKLKLFKIIIYIRLLAFLSLLCMPLFTFVVHVSVLAP
jgi:hypothetical protein